MTATDNPMVQIVVPDARDRWQGQTIRAYTPERVEQVLRSAVAGDLTAVWQMFDLMEDTWPRLAKALNEIKDAVCALEWNVQPWAAKGQPPTEEAQRRADFVEDLIWRMDPSDTDDECDFEGTLKHVLDAWGKGVSILEIDWAAMQGPFGQAIGPRATRWICPRYYGYPSTGVDRLALNTREIGISSGTGSTQHWTAFPPNKFLIGIHKAKAGHPSAAALLRPLGFWWAASNFTAEWFLNFAQIFGMPMRLAFYDGQANPSTISTIQEMLRCMGSAAYGSFPAGTQIELKEAAKGGGADNPQRAILEFADKVCDLLILRQTLTSDAGDRGTQALGTVHQSVRTDVIMAAAGFASRIINRQLVRPILRLNYGNDLECPWIQPCEKKVVDLASETGRVKTALSIPGFRVGKTWMHEHLQIPMPAPDEDVYEGAGQAAPLPATPGQVDKKPVDKTKAKACCTESANALHAVRAKATSATERVIERALENLTGVQARWLGGLKPWFDQMIAAAQGMTDEEWAAKGDEFLVRAQAEFPELFGDMDRGALASALEAAMGAALVNGAVEGHMQRRPR